MPSDANIFDLCNMCTSIQLTYSCIFMITYRMSVCAYIHTNIRTSFVRVHFVCQLPVWQYVINHTVPYALYNPTQKLVPVVVQWIRCTYMFWIARVSDPVGEIFLNCSTKSIESIFFAEVWFDSNESSNDDRLVVQRKSLHVRKEFHAFSEGTKDPPHIVFKCFN